MFCQAGLLLSRDLKGYFRRLSGVRMLRALKEFVTSFAFFAVLLPILIWLAIFSYVSFYYSYIPSLHFSKPLNFLRSDCNDGVKFKGSSKVPWCLSASVPLVEETLQPGLEYSFYLELEVPESDINWHIGMFEVELEVYTKEWDVIMSNKKLFFSQIMLEYKSWLHSNLETLALLPLYMMTEKRQIQRLKVPMMENFIEDTYRRSHELDASINNGGIQIYSASLHVCAKFSGIRYFMYFWPLTSAIFGVSTLFLFLSMVLLVSCLTYFRQRNIDGVAFPDKEEAPLTLKAEVPSTFKEEFPMTLKGERSD